MRRMTRKTSFFTGHWGMVDSYLLRFFWVAIKTERINGLKNKLRVLRSMGLMARPTHLFFERSMINLPPSFQSGKVMTIEAEFAPCFRGSKRLGVGSSFVARIALNFGHGIMNACFQELCLQ
jgi:hypothetical protein